MYFKKYITKPPAELNESLSLLHHARQDVKNHPSKADDSGTEQRTAMHYLNRIVNKLGGTIEVSSHMAAAAILGMPAETCSHSFQNVYVNAAIAYASKFEDRLPPTDDEFADCAMPQENDRTMQDLPSGRLSNEVNPAYLGECEGEDDLSQDDAKYCAASVYRGPKGATAVMQHEHYSYRGVALASYTVCTNMRHLFK